MAAVDTSLWQRIIHHVVATGGNIIRPWFTQLEPISLQHGLLEIEAPGQRERQYCREHAAALFTEAAQAATGRLVSVSFLAKDELAEADTGEQIPPDVMTLEPESLPLNDDYTFEAFVTGPCNRLAHAACVAVSESAGTTYNPLFLHGRVGLGKTHLLQAACHRIASKRGDVRMSILSCEMFVNDFIKAVESGQLHEFRYRYRHADVLAVDDIQFLSGHEQTQEEFFHTFNTLYQLQKQIILSSDRSPHDIPGLEERMVSRFSWGLVAQIDPPCYETRVAIVAKKARMRHIDLPEEVSCFIAATVDSNTRELEGAIAKVAMLAKVGNQPIDLALAEEALAGNRREKGRAVSIDDILKAVTRRFNVRVSDLQSKKRSRSISLPRQVCMFLARNLTPHSLEEIGGYFGGRDHTTVLHANRTIDALRLKDLQLQATIEQISQELQI